MTKSTLRTRKFALMLSEDEHTALELLAFHAGYATSSAYVRNLINRLAAGQRVKAADTLRPEYTIERPTPKKEE